MPINSYSKLGLQLKIAILGSILFLVRSLIIVATNGGYGIAKFYWADDTFYYLVIAHNIASGHGSTFDLISTTNGYHPLWLLICIPWFLFFPLGSDSLVIGLFLFQTVMVLCAAWLLFLALRRFDETASCFVFLLLLSSPITTSVLLNGMESTLAFALTAGLFFLAVTQGAQFYQQRSSRDGLTKFALLAGLCLSRLEASVIAAIYIGASAVQSRWTSSSIKWPITVAAGLSVLAAVYVGINLWLVGYMVPISGVVKQSWVPTSQVMWNAAMTHVKSSTALFNQFQGLAAVSIAILALQLAGMTWHARTRPGIALHAVALPFNAFAVIFILLSVFKSSGGFWWYGWPALFFSVISTFSCIAAVRSYFSDHRKWHELAVKAGLAVCLVLLAARTARDALKEMTILYDWTIEAALMDQAVAFVGQRIPADQKLAGHSVGLLSYRSRRPIMQTEGLVNDRQYFDALRAGSAMKLLHERGARWLVVNSSNEADLRERVDSLVSKCANRGEIRMKEQAQNARLNATPAEVTFVRVSMDGCAK